MVQHPQDILRYMRWICIANFGVRLFLAPQVQNMKKVHTHFFNIIQFNITLKVTLTLTLNKPPERINVSGGQQDILEKV